MALPALRGLIYAAIAAVALIFTFAALGTEIGQYKQDIFGGREVKVETTLWRTCSKVGSGSKTCTSTTDSGIDCSHIKHHFRAAQCFNILTMLMLFVCLVAGIIDHFKPNWLAKLPLANKVTLCLLAAITAFLSLLAWSITLAIPGRKFCGAPKASDAAGFSYGASPFLMLVVNLFLVGMIVVALIFRTRTYGERTTASHASNKTVQPYPNQQDGPHAPMG